jgi:hypothetical protein
MSVTAPAPAASADPPSEPQAAPAIRGEWRWHWLVVGCAVALAVWVTSGLWSQPYDHVLAENVGDQGFFEWTLGYGVQLLTHGGDPFFTTMMNTPLGVNLAANTSVTVYAIVLAPLTWLAGPQVTFVTVLAGNLAASAVVWYFFFLRWLIPRKGAAAIGGLFIGFAPGFISHANGHLNFTSGWIAPLVLWWLFKLREPGHWLRTGAILGTLLALCFTIAAEALFFTALAAGVFVVVWSLAAPNRAAAREAAPRFLAGLGVTAVVSGVLLAYPLWMHFDGPQTFGATGFNQAYYVEDLAAYLGFASRSLAAWAGLGSSWLASNPTEEASFLGLPLIILVVWSLVLLWRRADGGRRAVLRGLIVVGLVFLLLSLGPQLKVLDDRTSVWMPFAALQHLPLFDSALPSRFALVVAVVAGIILTLTADWLAQRRTEKGQTATAVTAAFVVALLPIVPTPLSTRTRAPEPPFISQGIWKQYVPDGAALSALPFAVNTADDGQRWQAYTMARGGKQFRIPDGYFLGPGGQDDTGQVGANWHFTDYILFRAAESGYITPIDDYYREQARKDFQYWNIHAVFLADDVTGPDGPLYRSAVEIVATNLLGPPQRVGGVLLWPIRPGVDPVTPPAK